MKNFRFTQDPGTTASIFADYVQNLLNLLPENEVYYLVQDNLNVHTNDLIYNLVTSRGHYIIPRPPYYPEAGPIEFFLTKLITDFMKMILRSTSISSKDELIQKMRSVLFDLHGVRETFLHRGYRQQ